MLGVPGATLLGLGSILGTGVFVSLGIAAGIAGPAVLIAIVLAGFVALCNALSSAQLAAAHPVAGGTYEYGYTFLNPLAGFTAGWTFMIAKSASAATAALGLAGYALIALRIDPDTWLMPVAVGVAVVMTLIVIAGLRRSNHVNALLVTVTLGSLAAFVIIGIGRTGEKEAIDWSAVEWISLPHAVALMFVAYTGYGRIATMGEEVREPRRTIPKAIVMTLVVSVLVYVSVAAIAVFTVGPAPFAAATEADAAPLESIARQQWNMDWLGYIMAIGAMAAMGGVLLNLLLGLSRVLLAMARRKDVPHVLSRINQSGTTPTGAVIVVGLIITGLVLIGDVQTTWSLSAFTVLIYYGLTNAAALRLPKDQRLYPRAFSWVGLIACGSLALSLDRVTLIVGAGVLLGGAVWWFIARAVKSRSGR